MTTILSHNITSPLGLTTSGNYDAVTAGRSAIRLWHDCRGIPGGVAAALFPDSFFAGITADGLSRFEALALLSASRAMADAAIDAASPRTLLVLSTTKGNVEWLGDAGHTPEEVQPVSSAKVLAGRLGIKTAPIVVDNACISGLSAIILAGRLIEMGCYDNAVVCGAEVQSKFIISGFQSLKAMSTGPCRPFDIERSGLNLGEAAATVVLGRGAGQWRIAAGCVRNDAFHISAPAKDGVGAYRALAECLKGRSAEELAFVNAHGTATLFNDQMEAFAIDRAGLGQTPVNAYKGYYGHTMGACGVLETVLSMEAVGHGTILPTKGFKELGVSRHINVVSQTQHTRKRSFVKMLSGFGGANAAILISPAQDRPLQRPAQDRPLQRATHQVRLTDHSVEVDGSTVATQATGKALLTELYKRFVGDYPRFYKMDILCRLGFIASELLLLSEGGQRFRERTDRAVMVVGRSGSMVADRCYYESIRDAGNYFPSPERFVFTLPNIVTGEIAIRNRYQGETGFFFLDHKDEAGIDMITSSAFCDHGTQSVIGGWIDSDDDDHFEADIHITERNQ